jgi:hypothetical protein
LVWIFPEDQGDGMLPRFIARDSSRSREQKGDAMTQAAQEAVELDGRHDFDFLFGHWRIANRKLADLFDQDSEWLEFEAASECRPILNGLGNRDAFVCPDFPGRGHFEGFTVRLLEPGTGLWRIWWTSTIGNGRLDTPVVGRFAGGTGRFECDDVLAGRQIRVRYDWEQPSPETCRWTQSFSFDGGETFEPNWIMDSTRDG